MLGKTSFQSLITSDNGQISTIKSNTRRYTDIRSTEQLESPILLTLIGKCNTMSDNCPLNVIFVDYRFRFVQKGLESCGRVSGRQVHCLTPGSGYSLVDLDHVPCSHVFSLGLKHVEFQNKRY